MNMFRGTEKNLRCCRWVRRIWYAWNWREVQFSCRMLRTVRI